MAEQLHREFAVDLEVRADRTGRTVTGIVVPFDREAMVSDGGPSYREKFRQGAFAKTIAEQDVRRVKLLSQHDSKRNPLGAASMLREDAAGLYGEFHVSKTAQGNDALELVRDGALDSFSVGFNPINHVKEGKVTVRTEVALREASLVTFPAYADAVISGVRSREEFEAMTPQQRADVLARLSQEIEELRSITPDQEPVSVGTPSGAAESKEPPTALRTTTTWRNNLRATLIEMGITS